MALTARLSMLALGLSFLACGLGQVTLNLSEPLVPNSKIGIKLFVGPVVRLE